MELLYNYRTPVKILACWYMFFKYGLSLFEMTKIWDVMWVIEPAIQSQLNQK
jgi:hypothetical protein